MNFVLGLIIGIFVAIGGAYVHDAAVDSDQAVVNWPILRENLHQVSDDLSAGWNRLTRRGG
jgi:hypothetical protein